jgi:SOS-response transcriptional repressors (RecA-mediated autopeptidases)
MALDLVSSFPARLEEARAGMTMEELGNRIGLSKQSISMYATGKRTPKQPVMSALSHALNVNPAWLLGYDVDKNLPSNLMLVKHIKKVPLIGRIACGLLAVENIEDYYAVPDFIDADFCLNCFGDSMINARIYDGDIVFIKQQPEVDDGEIAAVRIGAGEECKATLKRVYHGKNQLTLVAENSNYAPKKYENEELNEVNIIGKAVWFLSKVK